jgi:hypothetical protein
VTIEDRNLKTGTKLVAKYKGQEHACTVKSTKDGLRFVLEDGTEYKSPSSAGSAVMGGSACNGWRFWSLEGDPKPKASPTRSTTPKSDLTIKPMKGDPTRFWCSACMDSFAITEGETPVACTKGHANAPAEPEAPAKAKKAPAKRKAAAKAKA